MCDKTNVCNTHHINNSIKLSNETHCIVQELPLAVLKFRGTGRNSVPPFFFTIMAFATFSKKNYISDLSPILKFNKRSLLYFAI